MQGSIYNVEPFLIAKKNFEFFIIFFEKPLDKREFSAIIKV
jgi:hypothetical protein